MLIFGFRSYVKNLAMLTLVCGRCHNPAAHRLSQITRKFTLFFIPTFPISRRYVLTCAACGSASKVTKEQKDELLAGLQSSQAVTPPAPVTEQ
ncbi:zinc-ribbon domain-containing protein [Jatrophihabitans sp.]|uniref:zinc-ribbon domain-containing protein n=1 Tax=Jatrophihabitans sp. TaxID=1932789 RepID=UPI0030C6CF09|nr:zinc-ribbon protein [Jatrophihabitans sp.]